MPKASSAPMSLCAPRDTQFFSSEPSTTRGGGDRHRGRRFHPRASRRCGPVRRRSARRPAGGAGQATTDQLGVDPGAPRHGDLSALPPTPAPGPEPGALKPTSHRVDVDVGASASSSGSSAISASTGRADLFGIGVHPTAHASRSGAVSSAQRSSAARAVSSPATTVTRRPGRVGVPYRAGWPAPPTGRHRVGSGGGDGDR